MAYRFTQTYQELQEGADKIENIFLATYGATTYAEITSAISIGSFIFATYNDVTYHYIGTVGGDYYFAAQSYDGTDSGNKLISVNSSSVWSAADGNLASKSYVEQLSYASLMEDTASGPIASFPDGAEGVPVKELTAEIEPIQDLHGQSAPYPPNGGKNKLGISLAELKSANTAGTWSGDTYTLNGITFAFSSQDGYVTTVKVSGTATADASVSTTYEGSQTSDNYIADGTYLFNGCPSGGSSGTYYIAVRVHTGENVFDFGNGSAAFTVDNSEGDHIFFTNITIKSGYAISGSLTFTLMISLSTEADATFAPYSNICPISGYTGANIAVDGINIWDEQYELGTIDPATGQGQTNNNYYRSKNYIPIKGGETYYVNGLYLRVFYYDYNKSYLGYADFNNATMTPDTNVAFIKFRSATNAMVVGATSINYPSTDTSYHAYNGVVYSVSWSDEAGTVYKGYLVVNSDGSKKLYVTHKGIDLSSLSWNWQSTWLAWYNVTLTDIKRPATEFVAFDGIAEQYKAAPMHNLVVDGAVGVMGKADASNTFAVRNGSSTTQPSGKLVYPLATPLEYDLADVQQIKTLLGENNIFTDTNGDVDVIYRANTALYIEKKLGE